MSGPSFTVRAPATSANLGPGFDCLGLALSLHNTVTVTPGGDTLSLSLTGPFAGQVTSVGDDNLTVRALRRVLERAGAPAQGLSLASAVSIPPGRGLGSSSAAIAVGLVAGNHLAGCPFDTATLLGMGTCLEGHPDNLAAALYGGLTVAVTTAGGPVARSAPYPPGLRALLVIPSAPVSTEAARSALAGRVSLADAVHNLSRTALLLTCLRAGDWDLLTLATEDALHQATRLRLVPGLAQALAALRDAGLPAVVSGSGPSLLAFVPPGSDPGTAGDEAVARLAGCGTGADWRIVEVADWGAGIVS
ncbi:MAG: homoserine kinase [Bacillota bacterium]